MATLKDVARETGLTVSTVSRVLNNRGYISQEARKKVQEAMRKLDYQPNEMARALSKKTSNTIGVILPRIDHPYFARLLHNLENAAYRNDYKLLLFNSREKDEKENEYIEICKSARVAGIVMCSGTVDASRFQGLNVPLVTIECFLENGTAGIECDNMLGGKLAAKHLYEKGCKNVVYLCGRDPGIVTEDNRKEGFLTVCRQVGMNCISVDDIQKECFQAMDFREHIESVLDQYPEVDGIFGFDVIAAQVLQVCRKKGLTVPEQIKVIGFDDSLISELTAPALTTIHQPMAEMAELAITTVIKAKNNELVPNRTVLPVSLVERETT